MKRFTVSIIAAITIVLFPACSSGSADKKVPELANEMCDCFTKFQQGLSPDALALMKTVAASAHPQEDMIAAMSKLKPEDAGAFAEKMQSIATKGSDVFECMAAFDKRHGKETTKDKKVLTEKLLKEMRAGTNCPVGAAIVNISIESAK